MTFRFLALIAAISLSFSVHAAPKEARPTPDELMSKSFGGTFAGLLKGYAEIRMVITSPTGVTTDRTLSFRSMRTQGDLLLYLLRFENPADIRGTAFLVREQKGSFPQQYVYLPAAKQVNQVAAGKGTASFFGSDFLYADLWPITDNQKGDVKLSALDDKEVDGKKCYVVEAKINRTDSPYSRIVAYILQDKQQAIQVDFFGPDSKPLKTMKVLKFGEADGKPVPFEIEMKSTRGSVTKVSVTKLDPKKKFKEDEYFTKSALPNL